ncbi:NADH dehydrogenase [ubiquinone] 1 alpha subcomplex subunit 8-like [Bolinopsis microptera]|uniref:NADH dehydrogenase [ubiquinone] 1 alpha subcomplex subunit 8-like n=1 Tax=Bolinopsis microptera TaxID=2820187 RepID=UPI003078C2A4
MSCENIPWEEIDQYKDFNVTSVPLMAVADHLGQACKDANDRFMLCRNDTGNDPRQCLREGQLVTNCTKMFMDKVYKECKMPFARYTTCLDLNSRKHQFCRTTQIEFDKCLLEKTGVSREFTWFQDKQVPPHQTWPEAFREFKSDVTNIIKH